MMKKMTWRQPWQPSLGLMPCVLLCMALGASMPMRAQQTTQASSNAAAGILTLNQALEAAWLRSLEVSESRGRFARAQADLAVSQSWLAAAPAVSMGQREGRTGAPLGSRETELGMAFPLWRLGQRSAGEQAAQSQSGWVQVTEQVERLRLAGRLREAIGALNLAEVELQQVERQVQVLEQLTRDVERRLRAGDLAPSDALAARAEWLAAQAQASAARQALGVQKSQWHLLTGLAPMKLQTSVVPALAQLPENHPELVLASATLDLGQRRADLARVQRPDSPQLTLGMRQEYPGQGSSSQSSVVVALRVPVGGQVYQQPRIAAALGELDMAQTQAQRTRERLTAELELAQNQLDLSQVQLQAERERVQLLGERARLIDKSFRAGETALPEMLRAIAAAASAESGAARQHINHQTAIARLEQALGLLP